MFEAAGDRLAAAGVRCPRVLLADRSHEIYPGDIAVVEYVPGGSLEAVPEKDPAAASRPLGILADWLASMEACRATAFGKVAVVDAGLTSRGGSCAQVILDRALRNVDEIAARAARAAPESGRLRELLHALAEPLKPRADTEWEHVFLRLRFGNHYPQLARPALDAGRLRFYQLAQHLNLVAGPLRIADSGHPDRQWFLELAGYHLGLALGFER